MDLNELIAFFLAIVIFIGFLGVLFISNFIRFRKKIKSGSGYIDEAIVLGYFIILIASIIFCFAYSISEYIISDMEIFIGCFDAIIVFSLILATPIYILIKISFKISSKYKLIFIRTFMIISVAFSIWYGYIHFYSQLRLAELFNYNYYMFEELEKYAESDLYKGSSEGAIKYTVKGNYVWYEDYSGQKIKLEEEYLEDLFLKINDKCLVDEFIIYKNKDIGAYLVKNNTILSYIGIAIENTEDPQVKQILERTMYFEKLGNGWYTENSDYFKAISGMTDEELYKIKNR